MRKGTLFFDQDEPDIGGEITPQSSELIETSAAEKRYSKDLNESPVAKYRKVISNFVVTDIALTTFREPFPVAHQTVHL
ncbi:hypothetical protein TNCV_4439621 [Trichonephila clavipes]|nr:hypothetical protein TNCV_4439621 [Trichonephila clavipes]